MKPIGELLSEIESNEIVLPEFQREFEWKKSDSKDLVVSLYKEYPIGSVLRWKTETPPAIKNDAIDREQRRLFKVLLDGQQRLTVLYLFLIDEIPPYYEEYELAHDPRTLCFNIKTEEFQFENKVIRRSSEWVRVTECFNGGVDEVDIADEVTDDSDEFKAMLSIYKENLEKLENIESRPLPIQDLGKSANIHEAIEVFDKINTKGTPLNQAQITLAHMSAQWPHVRRNIKRKQREIAERGFDFNLDFYVKCMVAIATGGMNYEQSYEISQETLENKWRKLAESEDGIFDFVFNILEEEAHIPDSSYMTSRSVLIPLIIYLERKNSLSLNREEKDRFIRWLYIAMMWGRYSGSSDTALDHDLSLVQLSDSPTEELIDEIYQDRGRIRVEASDLEGKKKGSRFYTMLKIVTRSNNPVDWMTGEPLTKRQTIESHHIFPTSQLYKHIYESRSSEQKRKANEIANRAIITPRSNKEIGNELPAVYLEIVKYKHPRALESQFIPDNPELWVINNYEEFIANRRVWISDAINNYIESLIEKKGGAAKEQSLEELIKREEGKKVEFKETLLYHTYKKEPDTELRSQAVKEICSFINTDGGHLVIGVADDGTVKGIERDLEFMNGDLQKFEEQLEQEANNRMGGSNFFSMYVDLTFETTNGKTVCVILVNPRPNGPVYYEQDEEKHLVIRSGSSARSLSADEIGDYIYEHWR